MNSTYLSDIEDDFDDNCALIDHYSDSSLVLPTLYDITRVFYSNGTIEMEDAVFIIIHFNLVRKETQLLGKSVSMIIQAIQAKQLEPHEVISVVRSLCDMTLNHDSANLQGNCLTLLRFLCTSNEVMECIGDNGGLELLLRLIPLCISDYGLTANLLWAICNAAKGEVDGAMLTLNDDNEDDESNNKARTSPAHLIVMLIRSLDASASPLIEKLLEAVVLIATATTAFLSDLVSAGIISECVANLKRYPELCCELLWTVMLDNSLEFVSRGGVGQVIACFVPTETHICLPALRLSCHLCSLRHHDVVLQEMLQLGVFPLLGDIMHQNQHEEVQHQCLFLFSHLMCASIIVDVGFHLGNAALRTTVLRSFLGLIREQKRNTEIVQHATACVWKVLMSSVNNVEEAHRLQATPLLLDLLTIHPHDAVITHNTRGCLKVLDCVDL
eukprot:PhF_6_TR12883/c0_g1_i1/m.20267